MQINTAITVSKYSLQNRLKKYKANLLSYSIEKLNPMLKKCIKFAILNSLVNLLSFENQINKKFFIEF